MGHSELLSILLVTTCLLRGLFTLVKVSSCPSDYFSAIKKGWGSPSLFLDAMNYIQNIGCFFWAFLLPR